MFLPRLPTGLFLCLRLDVINRLKQLIINIRPEPLEPQPRIYLNTEVSGAESPVVVRCGILRLRYLSAHEAGLYRHMGDFLANGK